MESYIVRIYRRDKNDPGVIVGLVEAVRTGEVENFASGDELSKILCRKVLPAKGGRSQKTDKPE